MTATPPSLVNVREVTDFLRLIKRPEDLIEARVPNGRLRGDRRAFTLSGFYPDADQVAESMAEVVEAPAFYVTLNPPIPALLARANGRIKIASSGETTADHEIRRRRWWPMDLDPIRPAKISSTDEEHAAAIALAHHIALELGNEGIPAPIIMDSGNGAWLLFSIDEPTNDGGLIASVLTAMAMRFNTDAVKVDTSVFNASRIVKVAGTKVSKGDETADRRHRWAKVLSVPDELVAVTTEQLKSLAVIPQVAVEAAAASVRAQAARTQSAKVGGNGKLKAYDVDGFVSRHLGGGSPTDFRQRDGGTGKRWTPGACPFNPAHDDHSFWIIQYSSGAVEAGCSHDSCSWKWADLRAKFDPKPIPRSQSRSAKSPPANVNLETGEVIPPAPSNEELSQPPSESDGELIFDPDDPRPIARWYVTRRHNHLDCWRLLHDGETFFVWTGTHYRELKEPAVRADGYADLEPAQRWTKGGKEPKLVPFGPNQARVSNFVDAVRSLTYTEQQPPCWLDERPGQPDPTRVLSAANGLVHLRPDATAVLFSPPTPLFYSPNALEYAFDPKAQAPREWLKFLKIVWPDDPQSVDLLQEWFGYALTADTRQQKALLMVGPKRAGKGTVARVLSALVGQVNVCGPTLASLGTNFGLWVLLGKLLAIVSDARLSARTDQSTVTERILALTGEDAITVDRKNLKPLTVRIPARLMILTNELPKLADASGALASRFMVLMFRESFYGREDTGLEARILQELPGILLWAIAGWRRLQMRGRFIQPASSADAIEELNDLASPVAAFVREWCVLSPELTVPITDLFEAWGLYCKEHGDAPGIRDVFGRDLRATVGGIRKSRPREGGANRVRAYGGIGLTIAAKETLSMARNADQRVDRNRHQQWQEANHG